MPTLTGGGRVNTWDSENRLATCVYNGTTSNFTYAADGIRLNAVEPGVTGFMHAPGDVDALAGMLKRIVSDRALRDGMSRAAIARMDSWSFEQAVTGVRAALGFVTEAARA